MRYITSLNSQWFQKYEPSNLKKWKYLRFPYLNGLFFIVQLWRLVFLEPLEVQRRNVSHFKGLIVFYLDSRRSKALQNFYLLSRPLGKGHFTPKMAKCPRISVPKCICSYSGAKNKRHKILCKIGKSVVALWKPTLWDFSFKWQKNEPFLFLLL